MFRAALPGEVWSINKFEAHCLFAALERFADFFHEEAVLDFWLRQLAFEEANYNPIVEIDTQASLGVTPTDEDSVFFRRLIEKERTHLSFHNSDYVLPCGHEAREHEIVLSDWHDREIELADKFASSREAIARAPLSVKIFGPGLRLSREDAERFIEKSVERYIIRRKLRDMQSIEEAESERGQRLFQEAGIKYNREEMLAKLDRACQAAAEAERTRLWELIEQYIIV